ncbi:glycosyltransferase family 8 protein [Rhizobium sp. BG4]|uniref:glycosyltransferase family 8 protein n=1 Tax=Rhizobium sp. BG4 TaxID=2613770 RepID=UPI00193DD729|nr:glycosyltransferase family 8 protein [Rhizobium sp. BG4]QRM44358.1 glycosyltransferase family 8 protein [Rhizobium sp. BG4]
MICHALNSGIDISTLSLVAASLEYFQFRSVLMILACCIDRNYVELAGVMLRSVHQFGNVGAVQFWILADRLTEADKANIAAAADREVTFVDMTKEMAGRIENLKTTSYWSRSIYGRLLMPEIVDETCERIVYLDADVIVKGDISHLFETDLQDNLVAACCTVGGAKLNRRLGRNDDELYFNSGVLVLDVKKWRNEGLTRKAIELLQINNYTFMDQDVLNVLSTGRVLSLEWIWNAQRGNDFADAVIVHFIHAKPDSVECQHPEKDFYLNLRAQTPWGRRRLRTKTDRRLRKLGHSLKYRLRYMRQLFSISVDEMLRRLTAMGANTESLVSTVENLAWLRERWWLPGSLNPPPTASASALR